MKIDIKPLTVNRCWQGKRFKTSDYKQYEKDLNLLLPKKMDIPKGKLQLEIIFGLSNKLADIDNPCKPLIDILQSKYGFNDRQIYRLFLTKEDVKRGSEYIEFYIGENE